jgi:hypothetical protein
MATSFILPLQVGHSRTSTPKHLLSISDEQLASARYAALAKKPFDKSLCGQ